MLYFIDLNDQEIEFFDKSLKPFSKVYLASTNLSALNTNIVKDNEPVIVFFTQVSDEVISLCQKNSRIDLFIGWGEKLRGNEGSFSSEIKYLGVLDKSNITDQKIVYYLNMFLKDKKIQENFLKNRIADLQTELNGVVDLMEKEVLYSKEAYKKVRKKLVKDFKNINFSSLYKIGLNSGSEVSEIFKKENKLLWASFCTASYAASSDLLRVLDADCSFESFVDNFIKVIETGHHDADKVQGFLAEIDLSNLSIKGYIWGHYYFLSTNKKNIFFPRVLPLEKEFQEKAKFSFNFERGEKALLISPGVLKNFDQHKGHDELVKFCLAHIESGKEDLLDELMLELKMKYDTDFFENDSYLTYLEVPQNAIISV